MTPGSLTPLTAAWQLPEQVRFQFAAKAWQAISQGESWQRLFAVYDGARLAPRLYADVVGSGLPHECLFGGPVVSPLREAAPWCVYLGAQPIVARELFCRYWGVAAGIFITAAPDSELKTVRKQLKQLLRVQLPSGSRALFRFYDPRVLRTFLPTCDTAQWALVVGDHESVWCESEDGSTLLQYAAQFDPPRAAEYELSSPD